MELEYEQEELDDELEHGVLEHDELGHDVQEHGELDQDDGEEGDQHPGHAPVCFVVMDPVHHRECDHLTCHTSSHPPPCPVS